MINGSTHDCEGGVVMDTFAWRLPWCGARCSNALPANIVRGEGQSGMSACRVRTSHDCQR